MMSPSTSEKTYDMQQLIERAKSMALPTHFDIFLFLLHNRTNLTDSDLQTFGRFDGTARKAVDATLPRPRCLCHRNPPPPPAPQNVEQALERARKMYYILDAESIELLLGKYPHCGAKINSFLTEAETLISLQSYNDAKSNGPVFASRLVISFSTGSQRTDNCNYSEWKYTNEDGMKLAIQWPPP
jgi:hypothetical protein